MNEVRLAWAKEGPRMVTALLRRGVLPPERVELASSLGHPVAVAIYPSSNQKANPDLSLFSRPPV